MRSVAASPGAAAVRVDIALRVVTAARREEGARPEAGAGARQTTETEAETQAIVRYLSILCDLYRRVWRE